MLAARRSRRPTCTSSPPARTTPCSPRPRRWPPSSRPAGVRVHVRRPARRLARREVQGRRADRRARRSSSSARAWPTASSSCATGAPTSAATCRSPTRSTRSSPRCGRARCRRPRRTAPGCRRSARPHVAGGEHPVGGAALRSGTRSGGTSAPAEGGRVRDPAARRRRRRPKDVLPRAVERPHPGARVRRRRVDGDRRRLRLVFAEFTDQRLYRLDGPAARPSPLTPEPAGSRPGGATASCSCRAATRCWCVRETPRPTARSPATSSPCRSTARPPTTRGRSARSSAGSHFLAGARRLAGRRGTLAWIAWEHPQMPWDGTELRVGELGPTACGTALATLLGSTTESVLQPEWAGADALYVISDRSGYWNLYRDRGRPAATPMPLCPVDADFGGPLWQLGDAVVRAARRRPAADRPHVRHRHAGRARPADRRADATSTSATTPRSRSAPVAGDRGLLATGGAQTPAGCGSWTSAPAALHRRPAVGRRRCRDAGVPARGAS